MRTPFLLASFVAVAPVVSAQSTTPTIAGDYGFLPSPRLFVEAVQADAVPHSGVFLTAAPGGVPSAELQEGDHGLAVSPGLDVRHPVAAPEPATFTLTVTGLLAIAGYARRRAR